MSTDRGVLGGAVAIISGGARGQGAAEAAAFVAEGACVVIGDVLHDQGKAVADRLGASATYVELDVTDEQAWGAAVSTAVKTYGRLTTLVNNAGVTGAIKPLVETSPAEFRQILEVNLVSQFLGIRATAPVLAEDGGGTIINVSSINGLIGAPGIAAYSASKFGSRGLTRCAAADLAPLGIRVNAIIPGGIDTPMIQPDAHGGFDFRPFAAQLALLGRVAQPSEVAALAVWLASSASSYCTGADFVVDGGLLASVHQPSPA